MWLKRVLNSSHTHNQGVKFNFSKRDYERNRRPYHQIYNRALFPFRKRLTTRTIVKQKKKKEKRQRHLRLKYVRDRQSIRPLSSRATPLHSVDINDDIRDKKEKV